MIPAYSYCTIKKRQPVAPPPSNPLSSSNLSPLAPPFTVERLFPSSPPHSQSLPFSHLPSSAIDWSSSSRFPSFSAAGSFRSDPSTGVVTDPFYSRPYPNSPPSGENRDAFKPSGYSGAKFNPWNGPIDEQMRVNRVDPVAPWMEHSSGYKVLPFQKGLAAEGRCTHEGDNYSAWHGMNANSLAERHYGSESFEWPQDKHTTIYGYDLGSPFKVSNEPFSVPSASFEKMSYSGLPSSTSGMESSSSFVSNSSYDRYMAQLDSCLPNPVAFCPTTACSTSSQVYAPSRTRTNSSVDYSLTKKGPTMVHHFVPFKTNEGSNDRAKQNVLKFNETSGSKVGNDDKRTEAYDIKESSGASEDLGNVLPSSNSTAGEISICMSTELNTGLKIKNLTIAEASSSNSASSEATNSIKSSVEAHDQLNIAVDSPCWKGTPASRQSPFAVWETVAVQTVANDRKDCNDLTQDKKDLLGLLGNYETPGKQVGNVDEKNKDSSFSELQECSSVHSSNMNQKSEVTKEKGFDYENEIPNPNVFAEEVNKPLEEKENNSKLQEAGVTQLSQTETVGADKFPPSYAVADCEKGSSSWPRKNLKGLVKALHNSSVVLLSTDCNDGFELEENDLRLLRSVMNNIALVIHDKKAFATGHPRSSMGEAGYCCTTGLETEQTDQTDIKDTFYVKEKMQSCRYNMEGDEVESIVSRGCDDLKKANGMTQNLESVLKKTFSEKGENSQALLYKNLWIEAEVAICKLKYELQLARVKIEMESHKHQPKGPGKTPKLTSASGPSSIHELDEYDPALNTRRSLLTPVSPQWNERELLNCRNPQVASSIHQSKMNQLEGLEASVMERFKVLKDRGNSCSSRSKNEQEILVHSGDGIFSGVRDIAANNAEKQDLPPTYPADLDFNERVLDPHARDKMRVWSPLGNPASKMQVFRPRYGESVGPVLSTSTDASTKKIQSSDGSLSYMAKAKWLGNRLLASGSESSSFEWEHVVGDDLT